MTFSDIWDSTGIAANLLATFNNNNSSVNNVFGESLQKRFKTLTIYGNGGLIVDVAMMSMTD